MKILFESETCSISSTLSRKNTPSIDGVFFQSLKNEILGTQYDLSLVFVGYQKIKSLNSTYRKKMYATDILSFTIEAGEMGEIYIFPEKAYKKSKLFGVSEKDYLKYLLVHGISHLKGFDHEYKDDAAKMSAFESKILKKYNLKDVNK